MSTTIEALDLMSTAAPIRLDDRQLETTRRAMLLQAATDLTHAAEALGQLAIIVPWPVGVNSSDAQGAVSIVQESLAILEALGWPEDETGPKGG